jgi:hypothetical protein
MFLFKKDKYQQWFVQEVESLSSNESTTTHNQNAK